MWLRWAVGAAIYLPRSCPSGCELHATPVGAGGCGTRGRLWHLWDCVVLAYLERGARTCATSVAVSAGKPLTARARPPT